MVMCAWFGLALWVKFTHNPHVGDISTTIRRDVVVMDWSECVGALLAFLLWLGVTGYDSLTELAKYVCIGCVPGLFVGWVLAKLLVFEHCAGGGVKHWEGQWLSWGATVGVVFSQ